MKPGGPQPYASAAWVVRPWTSARGEQFERYGVAAIRFGSMPNLTGLSHDDLRLRTNQIHAGQPQSRIDIYVSELDKFVNRMTLGDVVISPMSENAGETEVLVGQVAGPYTYEDPPRVEDGTHTRPVTWLGRVLRSRLPEQARHTLGAPLTVIHLQDDPQELLALIGSGVHCWIEKTLVHGRSDRETGPLALGKALWSPRFASSKPAEVDNGEGKHGADVYHSMQEVRPNDWVLHLTDNDGFTARSRAASVAEDLEAPPASTPWSNAECQVVWLTDSETLDPPLRRTDLFIPPFDQQLKDLRATAHDLFYTKDMALRQGAYLTPAPPELVRILNAAYMRLAGCPLIPDAPGPQPDQEDLSELADFTNSSTGELREVLGLLRRKRQMIFTGPPGSGKTFIADAIARHLTENPLHGEELNDRYELIQFHQSYGYEDFMQGIRPRTVDGHLEYHVEPGLLKQFLAQEGWDDGKPRVLLIDEINRGNISRIFGELLLLLEYRDKSVRLPYSEEGPEGGTEKFRLPSNLLVIGTMNTADRSLASIDYALRRRFVFHRLTPVVDGNAPFLERWLAKQPLGLEQRAEVLRLFVALNNAVGSKIAAAAEDYQIGHSYFMTPDIFDPDARRLLWRATILPLLEEYFQNRKDRRDILKAMDPDVLLAARVPPTPDDAEGPAEVEETPA